MQQNFCDAMNEPSSIWFSPPDPAALNERGRQTANTHLGIEITEVGPDYLKGRMPVDERTRQPAGVLHGGVSVVLAETLASWAAAHTVDGTRFHCVGQEINANHVRAVSEGWVQGTARPLHLGRKSQVWEIHLRDEQGRLVCVSRMTAAVLDFASRYK
jgi:1,4-dihydroxy-2-naphthoyl-CoA hydrolase